jgi:MFS family permease
VTVTDAPESETQPRPSIWAPEFRLQVIGLVVVVTVVAIEGMSVATVMPTVVRDLHGLRFYSWGFTAYLLADVIGMVDAGRRSDRKGPAESLLGGLVIFAGGLVAASLAPDIWVFLAARVLQGLGGGSMIVAVYVVVARALPEALHPKTFAALSSAWVVPSLVGPALAGVVTSAFSWRWVFGGIAPIAVAGAAVLVPVLRSLPSEHHDTSEAAGRLVPGLLLAAGLALLQSAAVAVDWWSLPLVVAGLGLTAAASLRLLPHGSLRLARGLPTVIMMRGIAACAFFGAEAYLPLTLTQVHHGTPRVVGIPLTFAALGWAAGSWYQGRSSTSSTAIVRAGCAMIGTGIAALTVIAHPAVSLWVAVPVWAVAGSGMGLVIPVVSVRVLTMSAKSEQGTNSAALQIADIAGSIIGIAAAGALVTGLGLHRISTSVTIADALLAGIAALGFLVVPRVTAPDRPAAGS